MKLNRCLFYQGENPSQIFCCCNQRQCVSFNFRVCKRLNPHLLSYSSFGFNLCICVCHKLFTGSHLAASCYFLQNLYLINLWHPLRFDTWSASICSLFRLMMRHQGFHCYADDSNIYINCDFSPPFFSFLAS